MVLGFRVRWQINLNAGVQSLANLPSGHAQGLVAYPQTPPAGGDHSAAWQNCGCYDAPIASENAVHSLEHGAVWITFRPDLPREQVDRLRDLARGQTYLLVSPYPDLPAPMAASAWGKQAHLGGPGDPRLGTFIANYRSGPQAPEPGARCTSGTGVPT